MSVKPINRIGLDRQGHPRHVVEGSCIEETIKPSHSCGSRNPVNHMSKSSFVYIMASSRNGTLYVGVTSNLIKRVYEHKHDLIEGFTKKYQVHKLVYYEPADEIESAIVREKQIKAWKRQWKLELIEKMNPQWRDLYDDVE